MAIRFINPQNAPDISDPKIWATLQDCYTEGHIMARSEGKLFYADRSLHHQLQVVGLTAVPYVADRPNGECAYPPLSHVLQFYAMHHMQIITDVYASAYTLDNNHDRSQPQIQFQEDDLLTFGAGVNAGFFVKLSDETHGVAIAKVDRHDSSSGLLYVVFPPFPK